MPPKGKKTKKTAPPPQTPPSPVPAPPTPAPPSQAGFHLVLDKYYRNVDRLPIPEWEEAKQRLLREPGPHLWYIVLTALWGLGTDQRKPVDGSVMALRFNQDATVQVFTGDPDDPRPSWLNNSPPTLPEDPLMPPQPPTLGFSPITTLDTTPVEPTATTVLAPADPSPTLTLTPTLPSKKRKGKAPSPQADYAFKRRLDDKEAEKIAAANANTNSHPLPQPSAPTAPPPTKQPAPTSTPEATTKTKTGLVVHGIALRKDLNNVRRWLEAANRDLGKVEGIRWLRKKAILTEEGKTTSSVVIYLERQVELEKVRLGGKWLKASKYEWDRRRK